MAEPALTPVTKPVGPTEAMPGLLLLHTPPETASVSIVVAETQTVDDPTMEPADGERLTVTGAVAKQEPIV